MKYLVYIFFFNIFLIQFFGVSHAGKQPIIAINQFVNHVSLDSAYEGLRDALQEREVIPNKYKIILLNAQGSITTSSQISKKFVQMDAKFLVGISTPSSQTNFKAADCDGDVSRVLAFVAVVDPYRAGLIRHETSETNQNTRVIGINDAPPLAELMDISFKLLGVPRKIGVIYNVGEVNSVSMVQKLESILIARNVVLMKSAIQNSRDIKNAISKIVGEVDFIYIPHDNIVVSAIDIIAKIANKANVPLVSNDPSLIKKGILIAYGINYYNSGAKLGHMIADIIYKKNLIDNIQKTSHQELKINEELLEKYKNI